ncbi:aminotransferase class III-fold pyridoxal phosphate-dependent enzyme, partial [Streptosporangium algeriense]
GALAASGNVSKRRAAGLPLTGVTHVPYEGYLDGALDTIAYLEALVDDPAGGTDLPAAIVVETVQGEGGLASASAEWLRRLERLARSRGILLIVDDIQAGCGRTGGFFSFEEAGIKPDLVCMAKSISGYGLPMALTLIRPELDVLEPGAHAGTFRGNNLAFVTATASLDFWENAEFRERVSSLSREFGDRLERWRDGFEHLGCRPLGRGMFRGLAFADESTAAEVSRAAFRRGLLLETSGARSQVLKIMPPIVMDPGELHRCLDRVEDVLSEIDGPKGGN